MKTDDLKSPNEHIKKKRVKKAHITYATSLWETQEEQRKTKLPKTYLKNDNSPGWVAGLVGASSYTRKRLWV